MTTTAMRRTNGDDRWRNADQHLLNMPRASRINDDAARNDEAIERDRARRNILHGPTRDGCIPACVNPRHEADPNSCKCVFGCQNPQHQRDTDTAAELLEILGLTEAPTPPTAEPTSNEKQCTRCGDIKPRTGFYRRARSRDGLYSQCKPCHNAHKHVGAPA